MNLTDDFILKCLKGSPILLDDICAIFPVSIGEIVDEGYEQFQKYLGALIMSKPVPSNKEEQAFLEATKDLSDFQYILLLTNLDKTFNSLLHRAFNFFIHEPVAFSLEPAQIVVGDIEEKHILNEEKFYEFQRIIRKMYFLDNGEEEVILLSTDDARTRAIKLKMKENREKLRRAKNKNAGKSDLKFSDLIGSMTINNCGVNITDIWNMSYYAFHDQLRRMGWRDQFNINNSAALAGAKMKKEQLKHWMRSINDDKK